MAHGSPWPGEGGISNPEKAPLEGIFYLEHDEVDQVERISVQKAMRRLLPVASVPWYMARDTALALDTCGRLCAEIPAFILRFRKGPGVRDILKMHLSETVPVPDRKRGRLEGSHQQFV